MHLDVYLENSLILMIQTVAPLPYDSLLFPKYRSALLYYGSAKMYISHVYGCLYFKYHKFLY